MTTAPRTRVLLVEDDRSIAAGLVKGLSRYGFDVEAVATGAAVPEHPDHDIVLLDLGLPDVDGLDVCRALRTRSAVPIIVITARGDETDRVVGLELGADDYLAKPFGLRELVARMRAVLRRVAAPPPLPAPVAVAVGAPDEAAAVPGPQVLGRVTIDRRARRVLVDGDEVALSPREHDLLVALASDPGALITRETLMSDVWDREWFGSTRTLNVHVGTLRRKLGDAVRIEAVRGVGYRLAREA